jgi:hypothetical protein
MADFKSIVSKYLPVVVASIAAALAISKGGLLASGVIAGLGILIFVFFKIRSNIRNGFYLLMAANFFSTGLTRYVDLPLGLLIDFVLLLLFITWFLGVFRNVSWKPLHNPVFIAITIWLGFNFMELANPEARSFEAWFYAMRGVVLYFFFTLMIGYLILNQRQDFNWFINLWFVFSLMGTIWGMKQLYIGLDEAEKAWLNVPGNLSTHLLFGKLRVFSFYSDAGQFGASQAFTAIVAGILAIFEKTRSRKIFYIITSLFCFYGMLISGTRGAFAIPLVGSLAYLFLVRNFKIIITFGAILGIVFFLLKFTFVGQGVYEIRRLRTSLNPNDPSLQVRIANQKKLGEYLKHHPIGGGVGSAGYWGQRFSPGTFLANLALDSWYVRIAAEFGYPGLLFYVAMLIFILFKSVKKINTTTNLKQKNQLMALFCGLCGVLVASYANQVFGQLPTAILIYISIVFLTQPDSTNQIEHASITA